MEKSIYQMYQEYKDKEITDEYIEAILEALLEEELEPYVRGMKIDKKNSKNLATYSYDNRKIEFHKGTLESETLKISKSLRVISILKHELEHARYLLLLERGGKDIESTITGYSLRDYAVSHGFQTTFDKNLSEPGYLRYKIKENYEVDPSERLAEINAWKYIMNLIKNQKGETPDKHVARGMLMLSYKRGYGGKYFFECPALRFLFNVRMMQDYYFLKKRIEEKEYSFETRLKYGLPLTQDEYGRKILQKVKPKKKI